MDDLITFDPQGGHADAAIQTMMWQRIGMTMPLLATLDLDALTRSIEMAHTVGWFLDPTAYRDALYRGDMDTFARFVEKLKPAVEFWRDEIAPKMGGDDG